MTSPKVPALNLVKQFFALLRKEYHLKVTKETTAKDIQKAITKQQSTTKRLMKENQNEWGLLKRWQHQKGFTERSSELTRNAVWSKSKKGREYVRINMPWSAPQKDFIRERRSMRTGPLHAAFHERFSSEGIEIHTKESIGIMKSRLRK